MGFCWFAEAFSVACDKVNVRAKTINALQPTYAYKLSESEFTQF